MQNHKGSFSVVKMEFGLMTLTSESEGQRVTKNAMAKKQTDV